MPDKKPTQPAPQPGKPQPLTEEKHHRQPDSSVTNTVPAPRNPHQTGQTGHKERK